MGTALRRQMNRNWVFLPESRMGERLQGELLRALGGSPAGQEETGVEADLEERSRGYCLL